MLKGALKLFVGMFLVVGLVACSSGGGGGGFVAGPPATTLRGTVTDTALTPVAGVSVEIVGTSSATTTDAAGRYSFTGLAPATQYTLKYNEPGPSYFPTFAKATLTTYRPTVLDVYLTRAGNNSVPTIDDLTVDRTVASTAFIGGAQLATLTLPPNELEDATDTPYTGTASVYIAPIDVGKLGYGLASYQTNLGNVFAALTASSSIVELHGAAAVRINDDAGNPLSLVAPSTSTLEIPIPASPVEIRDNAPLNATLFYLDESTGAWVADGTAASGIGPTSYTGEISRTGIWRVGTIYEFGDLTEITGQVTYSNTTPAGGVTVYVNGVDYAYQEQTTTDANGNYSVLAKAAGTVTIHCVVSANGAQWTHEETFLNPTLANIGLSFAPPVVGAAAQATITVDDRDIAGGGNAPDVLGYVLSSGRQLSEPDSADDSTARNIGNVVFVASDFVGAFPITIGPSLNGSGIQVVAGTFETLSTVPTTGYKNDANSTAFTVNLDPAITTFPVLLAVQTDIGHYGKISIDSVTPLNLTNNEWQITFRHAFSLTNTF